MDPITQRMQDTGWTREKVMAELEMMMDAKRRFETGQLTAEDRREIARCRKHWQPQGYRRG